MINISLRIGVKFACRIFSPGASMNCFRSSRKLLSNHRRPETTEFHFILQLWFQPLDLVEYQRNDENSGSHTYRAQQNTRRGKLQQLVLRKVKELAPYLFYKISFLEKRFSISFVVHIRHQWDRLLATGEKPETRFYCCNRRPPSRNPWSSQASLSFVDRTKTWLLCNMGYQSVICLIIWNGK